MCPTSASCLVIIIPYEVFLPVHYINEQPGNEARSGMGGGEAKEWPRNENDFE